MQAKVVISPPSGVAKQGVSCMRHACIPITLDSRAWLVVTCVNCHVLVYTIDFNLAMAAVMSTRMLSYGAQRSCPNLLLQLQTKSLSNPLLHILQSSVPHCRKFLRGPMFKVSTVSDKLKLNVHKCTWQRIYKSKQNTFIHEDWTEWKYIFKYRYKFLLAYSIGVSHRGVKEF